MSITSEEIEKLAKLAKLEFSESQMERFTEEFDEIIAFADTINQSVEGKNQEIRSIGVEAIPYQELRDDCVIPSLPNEKILSNVEAANGFFSIKRSKK